MDNLITFKDAWAIAVAMAWENATFRQQLLDDPAAALESPEINFALPDRVQLIVLDAGETALNTTLEPDKDSALVAVLPKAPDDLDKGATSLADYLRRIDPPANISCLC